MSHRGIFNKTHLLSLASGGQRGERERERESGTGFLFEEPNPTGSRPSVLIGLYTKWQSLFERETEHGTCKGNTENL